MLQALSPLDGRYEERVGTLRQYFSELALQRARLFVEVSYLIALSKEANLPELPSFSEGGEQALWNLVERFDEQEGKRVKELEKTTRHDVKAIEYFLRERVLEEGILSEKQACFIHFGLTSADVNNLTYGCLIHQALREEVLPTLEVFVRELSRRASRWKHVELLSLTHGQAATPTTVGKELRVFVERLQGQLRPLRTFRLHGKCGGAVGTFAAHKAAYPDLNWERFGHAFVQTLGLRRLKATTQINPHDDLAELSHRMSRIESILLDYARDMWLYISRGTFQQKTVAGEVGSSTMPHKVNPIDCENAEGNLGISRALWNHFAEKLPVSRLQRDLSDSTVMRNIGVAFGHHLLAVTSLHRGLKRLALNRKAIRAELQAHPEVMAEAIQTVLRKHGVADAYERLKDLTRGEQMTAQTLREFIRTQPIPEEEKQQLLKLVPRRGFEPPRAGNAH